MASVSSSVSMPFTRDLDGGIQHGVVPASVREPDLDVLRE